MAVKAGAKGVEFDVHLTRDGIPVVVHDEDLRRTTGIAGLVGKTRLSALPRQIPTLADTLRSVRGMPFINIEIKGRTPGIVQSVRKAVARAGLENRVVVSSFDRATVLQARKVWPSVRVAWNLSRFPLFWDRTARRMGLSGVHPDHSKVSAQRVARAHAAGLWVWAWTTDDPKEIRRLAAAGVDGIFSNDPVAAEKALGR